MTYWFNFVCNVKLNELSSVNNKLFLIIISSILHLLSLLNRAEERYYKLELNIFLLHFVFYKLFLTHQ